MGKESLTGKILDAVIQGFGEGLNEGSATGGTGLVEKHTVHGLILDLDALHVLAADIQNAVHLRIEEGGSVVMGYGFHFTLVQHQGSLNQCFSVAGGTGIPDRSTGRKQLTDLLHGTDRGL